MTTATDHKNLLNRSTIKKNCARTLRVKTIANLAGGTAAVAMVMQPSTGFLNARYMPDGSPSEDTEDCLGRITVGLTRSKSLTIIVSPLDMIGMIGMAQVLATLAYGIKGLRRGTSTWDWPYFHSDPVQENSSQMDRWSLNQAPSWAVPPLAIANKYNDPTSQQRKCTRYRLILVRSSDFYWLTQDRYNTPCRSSAQKRKMVTIHGCHTTTYPLQKSFCLPTQQTVRLDQLMSACPQGSNTQRADE